MESGPRPGLVQRSPEPRRRRPRTGIGPIAVDTDRRRHHDDPSSPVRSQDVPSPGPRRTPSVLPAARAVSPEGPVNSHARAAGHHGLRRGAREAHRRPASRGVRVHSPFLVRTFDPPLDAAERQDRPGDSAHRQTDRLGLDDELVAGAAPDDRGTAALEGPRRQALGEERAGRLRLPGRAACCSPRRARSVGRPFSSSGAKTP